MNSAGCYGSVLHAWTRHEQVRLAGRLRDGRSFAAVIDAAARREMQLFSGSDWRDWEGQAIDPDSAAAGLSPADELLLARGIRGAVHLQGEWQPGQRVDCFFRNPRVTAAEHALQAVWAAIDIETDRHGRVTAVSLAAEGYESVLIQGPDTGDTRITSLDSEKRLLEGFCAGMRHLDPDVITGWNVTGFDFTVLARRCAACGVPFDIGRTGQEHVRVRTTPSGLVRVVVPGRQVVDAMKIVRGSGRRFDGMRLETVAQGVLGTGKSVTAEGGDKMVELERLQQEDPRAFGLYCLRDSRLVLDILRTTGLDTLSLARAGLTGISLDMAWTSIPAFERIYALELIKRRIRPPRAAAPDAEFGAPGGTVLEPIPGLFRNVLVFDFRSLYPAVMRSFNIDPLAYARAQRNPREAQLIAPNGAGFSRQAGILPNLLDGYFRSRQQALEAGDSIGAHVYKILMNSFYGVLGSSGCIYARRELAGAITGFGKLCLHFARDFFRAAGMTVLYGDTDSVFVYAAGAEFAERSAALAQQLNQELDAHIRGEYGVESQIRIRFEQAYRWLLLPRLRAPDAEERIRGRAKGYAGLTASGELEVRGIESARSDYTALARRVQRELLQHLFAGADAEKLAGYMHDVVLQLRRGQLDSELVYHKVLRRPAREYIKSVTPQVRAARRLGWTTQRGRISYVMSLDGPKPVYPDGKPRLQQQITPDYSHYIDHQLQPIWKSIVETVVLGDSLVRSLDPDQAAVEPNSLPPDHPATAGLAATAPFDDQLQLGLD